MAHLVLSYPTFASTDLAWIQQIRQQFDPLHSIVAPHFTLVFPTRDVDVASIVAHIRDQARGTAAITVTLRCALVVKDALGDATQSFLVPDQGFSEIVKLHDKLYTGLLAEQLRLDIPYIPHITVATAGNPVACKRIVDEINRQAIAITGVLDTLDIVEYAHGAVTTLQRVALGTA